MSPVIRRHVLAALAAGIEAADDNAARRALRTTDWAIRGLARRRLERALIDAALATLPVHEGEGPRPEMARAGGAEDPEEVRHVQRLAALSVARVAVEDPLDRARVAAAYRALPVARAPRVPIATIVVCLLGGALAAVFSLYAWTRPDAPKRAYARPLPPPAFGAYKDGGVPLPDPALEKLFVEELTSLVIETDRDRQSGGRDEDRKAHGEALAAAPAIASHGPALVAAWTALIDGLDRWVSVPQSSPEFRTIAREHRDRARAVSEQLAAAGLGYYLEGSVYVNQAGAHALVYAYRVEEVVFVTAGDRPRRVLSLRRLDRLNLTHTLLGMQSQELGDPVLLLDQIDQHVATQVLPVLAPEAAYVLADDAYQGHDGAAIAKLAGDAIRRELDVALGADANAAHEIAALLAERASIVERWRDIMERRGWRLPRTDDLFLPEGLLDQLEGAVSNAERRRVAAIEDRLAALEAPRIASRCHELVAATVRRHEAQHGLDDDREAPLRYPAALADLLGDATYEDGEPREDVDRARAELSAYTSQLANDPVTPQLSLWNVARFAFHQDQWGTAESYAAVVIVEGLARHLGIPSPGPVIHSRKIDRARLVALTEPMARVDGETLRAAARALWRDLYGEPSVAIVDR